MFSVNRIMALTGQESISVHLNGKEICIIESDYDVIECLETLTEKLNEVPNKPLQFINEEIYDINISDEAFPLLFSVKQFTQEEEKAFINRDWNKLNELLLQRIEDGELE